MVKWIIGLVVLILLAASVSKEAEKRSYKRYNDSLEAQARTDTGTTTVLTGTDTVIRSPSAVDQEAVNQDTMPLASYHEAVQQQAADREHRAVLDSLQSRYFPVCSSGKQLALTSRWGSIYEVRGLVLNQTFPPLQEVDRLNGVEWIGEIHYRYPIAREKRIWGPSSDEWADVTGRSHSAGTVTLRRTRGRYEVKVEEAWRWEPFSEKITQETRAFGCSRV